MVKLLNSVKNKLYTPYKYLTHPEKIVYNICNFSNYRFAPLFSDKLYLKCLYKRHFHKKLNLSNPTTFNEKLQWLKLHDRHPEYTGMADKAEVKEFVSRVVGKEYTVPTIGVYDSIDAVPFNDLPDQYVIKCTHDSGSTFICKNKTEFDVDNIKNALAARLKNNYFWPGREFPYKNIRPRIIVEEYLCDENGNYPVDYKLFCFSGKMKFVKVDFNRFTNHQANYYNKQFELQAFGEAQYPPDKTKVFVKPEGFETMIDIAEELSSNIPFLRVDFYNINGRVYVGELTFFPAIGIGTYIGNGDEILGRELKLPTK